jgi:hypothetical protein
MSAASRDAKQIAGALLSQAPASRWLEAGVAEGTEEFWLAAAQAAGTNPPSPETRRLVVELIRTAEMAAA